MKKKILSLMLASAIAASAFGMVACIGDGGDHDDRITADTDPATIKSEQVADEAAWQAAFDYTGIANFSARSVMRRERDGKVYTKGDSTLTMTTDKYGIDGTYTSRKYDDETGDYVMENGEWVLETRPQKSFAAMGDGKNYQYEYDVTEKAWYRKETDKDVMKNAKLDFRQYETAYNGFAEFTFENGAYTATFKEDDDDIDNVSDVETYTIKIQNGKIVYFGYVEEWSDNDEDEPETGKTVSSIIVFNVGKTTVTLPTDFKTVISSDE
ncbi:MAG: hypothetical protein K2J01_06605 [Clostridiales bacterium]|nr:hypothetical protein [Clostridiales bacterium]